MKKKVFYILILCVVPLMTNGLTFTTAMSNYTGYTGPKFDSTNFPDFQPNVPYVCANQFDQSNVTFTLNLADGTPDDQLKFNTTSLVAPKDACVALVYKNLSPDVVHDLVIEAVNGTAGITHVDMDVYNSTANIGWGPGVNVFFFHTPNVDAQFTYFCEQPGHRAIGEVGTLFVGTGPSSSSSSTSSSLSSPIGSGESSQSTSTSTYNTINGQTPSFEFLEVFLGFLFVVIVYQKRKD